MAALSRSVSAGAFTPSAFSTRAIASASGTSSGIGSMVASCVYDTQFGSQSAMWLIARHESA